MERTRFLLFCYRTYLSILPLALFCLVSVESFGQRPYYYPQAHEVGLIAASAHYHPSWTEVYRPVPPGTDFLHGFKYKYHLNVDHALRITGLYRSARFEQDQAFQVLSGYAGKKSDWEAHLGYERTFHQTVHQYFWGLDAGYGKGSMEETGTLPDTGPYASNLDYQQFTGTLFGGYRYFFSKHLSAAVEARAYYGYIRPDNPDALPSFTLLEDEREWGAGLQVDLSYHFVRMSKRCACPRF